MMTQDAIANYHSERAAFEALWQQSCDKRVLFYRGRSGSGKSTLLKICRKKTPETVHKLLINFSDAEIRVADIFALIVDCLGWERLSQFRQQLTHYNTQLIGKIENNTIEGDSNIINQVINVGSPEERKDRQVHLTAAWLQDMHTLDKPFLLTMDTYESSIAEVQDLIHRILMRIKKLSFLRLVVAGQTVPDVNSCAEWTDYCQLHDLFGVLEAKHWLPVVEQMGRKFPAEVADNPLNFLAGICYAMKGHPTEIKKLIEAFPRSHTP